MKRFLSITICLALTLILMSMSVLGACSNQSNNVNTPANVNNAHYKGTIKKTSKVIIDNKTSHYSILIPQDASDDVKSGADELKVLLLDATGVELSIVSSDSYVLGNKYFSLGNTKLAQDNNIKGEYATLGEQGFGIKTIEDNIFIYSARDKGVLYGVYGFLEYLLNFDFFGFDVYTIDKVSTLHFYDMDLTDTPDIAIRVSSYKSITDKTQSLNRMRMIKHESTYAYAPDGGCWHNWFGYINPNVYGETHPEYFNDIQNQLCYTAHGNEESLQEMIDITSQTMFECFQGNDKNEIVMAIGDDNTPCLCTEPGGCLEHFNKYGALSSTVVKFLNRVAVQLEQKFRDAGDQRADTFLIVFYAYYYMEDAPVTLTYDANGNPVCSSEEEVKCSKHVTPKYASASMDYTSSFYSEDNTRYRENLIKWNYIANNLHFWGYDQYFRDGGFMFAYNTFFAYKDFYKFVKEYNVQWMVLEGQWNNAVSTGFNGLKPYLQSKLGWNINVDIDLLVEKYFNAMYGTKSDEMLNIFYSYVALLNYQIDEVGISTAMGGRGFYEKESWPKNIVEGWYNDMTGLMDQLIINGERAEAKRVSLELISPLYAIVRVYAETYNEDELYKYKVQLKDLLNSFNIMETSQEEDVSVFIKTLNI